MSNSPHQMQFNLRLKELKKFLAGEVQELSFYVEFVQLLSGTKENPQYKRQTLNPCELEFVEFKEFEKYNLKEDYKIIRPYLQETKNPVLISESIFNDYNGQEEYCLTPERVKEVMRFANVEVLYVKQCPWCKTWFTPTNNRQIFCQKRCRLKSKQHRG